MFRNILWGLTLAVLGLGGAGAQQSSEIGKVMMIMDSSGSMWGRVEDKTKIVIARDAIETLLTSWPDTVEIGLMAYGHHRKGDCADIETLVPVGKLDRQNFMAAVNGVTPNGKTPISAAVRQAAEAIKYTEEKAHECRVGGRLHLSLSSRPPSIPCMRFALTRLCCYPSLTSLHIDFVATGWR
jgi:Ca-activated chloride channel family protein